MVGLSGWGIRFGGRGGVAVWRGVYARHRLDISAGDISIGVVSCGLPWRREKLEVEVLRQCSLEEEGLVCLSVRRKGPTGRMGRTAAIRNVSEQTSWKAD